MNTNMNDGSAKIFQFPQGGRDALRPNRPAEVGSQIVSEATYGSWYHDEAIRESQQAIEVQTKSSQAKPSPTKILQNSPSIIPLTFPRQ